MTFNNARTLIGGPNESGKSTLVEAAHRALFMRAKTGGRLQQGMRSTLHTGHPEVTLSFEARGQVWDVEKRFSGSTGQTRLNAQGGQSWQGDEAESRLAELLGAEPGLSTQKQLDAQWPHLWVWQGRSGDDPADHTAAHRDALVQRLQQEGLGAVMQSDFDQRVRERITASYEELFTATGKLKANSKPELARQQLEEAELALSQAQEASLRLEQAVKAYDQAGATVTSVNAVLPALQAQRQQTEAQMQKVRELRIQEQQHLRDLKTAATLHADLHKENAQLVEWQQQALALVEKLKPQEQQLAELTGQQQTLRETVQQQETSLRSHADALREARLRADCAAAFVTLLERQARHAELSRRCDEASKIAGEIKKLRDELAQMPALTSQDLSKLRAYESAMQQAHAALDAMAAELTLISSKHVVRVGGKTLDVGGKMILTEEVEVFVGDDTRLLLSPGGGSSLKEARAKADLTQRILQQALDQWAVADVSVATEKFEQAQSLRQTLGRYNERWETMGGESLSKELDLAHTALEKARADAVQRQQMLASTMAIPDSITAAQQMAEQAHKEQEAVDREETAAAAMTKKIQRELHQLNQSIQQQNDALSARRQQLHEIQARIRFTEEKLGDSLSREKKLSEAAEHEAAAKAALESTQGSIQALQPHLLEGDLARYIRSIQTQEQQLREAETQLAVSRSQLVLDGRIDPQAELQQAMAKVAGAAETHAMEQRRAKAIERLYTLFNESRESIDRRMVQPLADRISGYLQCVFGTDCAASIQVSAEGRMGLEFSRAGASSFAFETLSGGAKEQVAAAVRLAMAELLAASHDGCLPLVFDDAFAYADPQRVMQLQRMLDLAAMRGLQIIVLTCDPASYSAFGAAELRLD